MNLACLCSVIALGHMLESLGTMFIAAEQALLGAQHFLVGVWGSVPVIALL